MAYANATRIYLTAIKDWKIRNMVAGYVEARMLFKSFRFDPKSKRVIPFEDLRRICDILFETKEDHHLLFRRPEERGRNGDLRKFEPNAAEQEFLNNVGLLFHRVLVARELRYVIERYPAGDAAQQTTFDSLRENLEKIDRLFDEGVATTVSLIQSHGENVLLISYILEDNYRLSKVLQVRADDLLLKMTGKPTTEKAYMMAARYYVESGWYDKAGDMLKRALKGNPDNIEAKQLLERYGKLTAPQF